MLIFTDRLETATKAHLDNSLKEQASLIEVLLFLLKREREQNIQLVCRLLKHYGQVIPLMQFSHHLGTDGFNIKALTLCLSN